MCAIKPVKWEGGEQGRNGLLAVSLIGPLDWLISGPEAWIIHSTAHLEEYFNLSMCKRDLCVSVCVLMSDSFLFIFVRMPIFFSCFLPFTPLHLCYSIQLSVCFCLIWMKIAGVKDHWWKKVIFARLEMNLSWNCFKVEKGFYFWGGLFRVS